MSAPDANGVEILHGDVRVNTQVVGFKKVKFYTLENVGAGHLSMPEQEMHTTSFWLHFPASFLAQFPDLHATGTAERHDGPGQCLAVGRGAAVDVRPARSGCRGYGRRVPGEGMFEPNLYLYDSYPGRNRAKHPIVPARAASCSGTRTS